MLVSLSGLSLFFAVCCYFKLQKRANGNQFGFVRLDYLLFSVLLLAKNALVLFHLPGITMRFRFSNTPKTISAHFLLLQRSCSNCISCNFACSTINLQSITLLLYFYPSRMWRRTSRLVVCIAGILWRNTHTLSAQVNSLLLLYLACKWCNWVF